MYERRRGAHRERPEPERCTVGSSYANMRVSETGRLMPFADKDDPDVEAVGSFMNLASVAFAPNSAFRARIRVQFNAGLLE